MKIIYWCILVVLSPVAGLATTISAYSHMEEHIPIFNKTDAREATAGMVTSYVESEHLPEHDLQGNTFAQSNVNGSLRVSAVGLGDTYGGENTYFKSTASWSQEIFNDDANKHYLFDFDISDIDIGSDYRSGMTFNRTGYEINIFLDGSLFYAQSFIFDTTTLYHEYVAAMRNGTLNPPPGENYFTIAGTGHQLDLGYFSENTSFTLQYQIMAFAQPIDISSCYTSFGMAGSLGTEITPVPEPASMLLFGTGILFGCFGKYRFRKYSPRMIGL